MMTHSYESKAALLHVDASFFVNKYSGECRLKMGVKSIYKAKSILCSLGVNPA